MAFVFKSKESKYWIAGFLDGSGKRRNRSTKETDQRKAQKIAEEYETAARKKRTARQVRSVISSLHREITGEDMATMTVRQFVEQWLKTKKPETAESTHTFYKGSTDKFLDWLGPKADGELGEITKEQILAFRNNLAGTLAAKTVNHDLKCLRMVFKAAFADSLIAENPAELVKTVRNRAENNRAVFTLDQLAVVLDHAEPEWKSMILFGLYTGQRLGDVASLTWANIDLARGEIRLQTRKTGKHLSLPIPLPLQEHLTSLPASDDPNAPVHPQAFAILERQKKTGGLSNQFADILSAAGLRPKTPHRKGKGTKGRHSLSFHSLRATATTLLHEAGVPAAVAQALIGHDSEEIHRLYTKVGKDALKDAAAKLPRVRTA
ncbi:tyrosine-type recombinase/integrase [Verrucomicrobiota bacterium sgz303538]